jgi:hypothetical protein
MTVPPQDPAPHTGQASISRRLRQLRSTLWLIITTLPDRWSEWRQAGRTIPAPTIPGNGERSPPMEPSVVAPNPVPSWLGDPRRSLTADSFLLLLGIAAVAACLSGTDSPARSFLVLAAACLVPGAAILTRLPVTGFLDAAALVVTLGVSIEATGAVIMVWTGWWHPVVWAILVLVFAWILLASDLWRNVVAMRERT